MNLQDKTLANIDVMLLSPEKLRQIIQSRSKPEPYIIKRDTNDQSLVFIGTRHSNDIADPQFEVIKSVWHQFLKTKSKQPRIVLIEGGAWPARPDIETSVLQAGESGFMTYLAHEEKIPVFSPEPNRKEEADALAKTYGQDVVMLCYFLRQIAQWHRGVVKPDVRKYMQKILDRFKSNLNWEEFDFSYDNLKLIYQQTLGHIFDLNNEILHRSLVDPTKDETVINKVAQSSSQYRNLNIAREIIAYWKDGYSIFATYGSGHAYVLEPILLAL